jgi:predicted alpha-1,6-mannanase (GH76 family)
MLLRMVALLFLSAGLLAACRDASVGQGAGPATPAYVWDWTRIADSSTTALTARFYNAGGRYFNADNAGNATFNYWPQAHALDVLTDAYLRTADARYPALMNDWMDGVRQKNGGSFLNEYYDDMAWNALAMLRAYDATNDRRWLDATLTVWTDIQGGWNAAQGGGIAWRKSQRDYKNTPANAPAAILAARLYQRLRRPADLDWALKIYDWQKRTLVDPASGLVYDGINRQGDGQIDLAWKFTYCQGVFIGAALELYRVTQQASYLGDATKTADFTLTDPSLNPGGLLRDEGGGDGGLFKGVFVRYFTQLALEPSVPAASRGRYAGFLRFNAETLWQRGTTRPALLFGTDWSRPPAGGRTDLTTQLSGATLLEAVALLKKNNAF